MTPSPMSAAGLIAEAANELDQLFRQRHTMKEVECILQKLESATRAAAYKQCVEIGNLQMENEVMSKHVNSVSCIAARNAIVKYRGAILLLDKGE